MPTPRALMVVGVINGKIYIASGQYLENGEGPGRLCCIDPTKQGDISLELEDGPGNVGNAGNPGNAGNAGNAGNDTALLPETSHVSRESQIRDMLTCGVTQSVISTELDVSLSTVKRVARKARQEAVS